MIRFKTVEEYLNSSNVRNFDIKKLKKEYEEKRLEGECSSHLKSCLNGCHTRNLKFGGQLSENKTDNSTIEFKNKDFKGKDLTKCFLYQDNDGADDIEYEIILCNLDIFNLEGSTYNSYTRFPKGFIPTNKGMVYDD